MPSMINPMAGELRNPFTEARIMATNFDSRTYHALTGNVPRGDPKRIMSRSELIAFAHCPSKWIRTLEGADDGSKATDWGSLFECLVCAPSAFDDYFVVRPDTYRDTKTGDTKPWAGNATYCRQWKKDNAHKIIITAEPKDEENPSGAKKPSLSEAKKARDRFLEDERMRRLIACSQKSMLIEAAYFDKQTELIIPVKMLLDLVPDKEDEVFHTSLADLKTARSAHPRLWTKAVFDQGYDIQAAMYRDGYNAATGEGREDFLHAICENEPPYEPALWAPDLEWMGTAQARYASMLSRYCQCLAANTWPSYPIDIPISCWGLLKRAPYMVE